MTTPRILVVDDEIALCAVLEDLLSLEGCEVITCQTIECAREHLAQNQYDVALLDVFLTDEPLGLRLADEIMEKCPATTVVFMTGFANHDDIEKAFASGAHACIAKPFSLDDVMRVIGAALETKTDRAA